MDGAQKSIAKAKDALIRDFPKRLLGNSGSTIAVPRTHPYKVAFFSRKCHLARCRKGHVNCGAALKALLKVRSGAGGWILAEVLIGLAT